jgi:hypothetical protein
MEYCSWNYELVALGRFFKLNSATASPRHFLLNSEHEAVFVERLCGDRGHVCDPTGSIRNHQQNCRKNAFTK